jgi:hypothetical protein
LKNLWQILADFVADFVAGSTKPLDNQGIWSAYAQSGRESEAKPNRTKD